MKLLIVTQYYWPEYFIINRLSQKLVQMGHEVTIATGKPNYPEGKIFAGYSVNGVQHQVHEGVNVVRVPLTPRKTGAIGLAINYISFVYSGIRYFPGLFKNQSFDCIFVFGISPITAAIPAILLKKKLNAKLAIWVQDLWPESLSATGYVKNRFILKAVGLLVKWIYSRADIILAQSNAFIDAISKYANRNKVIYYPNSIESPDQCSKISGNFSVDLNQQFSSQFSIVFAGNIGQVQAIPTILDAAELLVAEKCKFFFIGDGSLKAWAEGEVLRRKLTNVVFLGRYENKIMPAFYEKADLLLVTLNKSPILSLTIPSKLQAYLAAGKPIVASLDGEAAKVLNESGAGFSCEAEDAQQLAAAIMSVVSMSIGQRKLLGDAGKKYFIENFDMNKMAKRLVDILVQIKG